MGELSRKPWLAVLLSFAGGPVGHVYAGAMQRSVVLWLVGVSVTVVSLLIAIVLPLPRTACFLLYACTVGIPLVIACDAFRIAVRNPHACHARFQRWWVYVLFAVLFITGNFGVALSAKSYLIAAFVIPTRGMLDTLLPGDKILVDKTYYRFRDPKRGDIAVFLSSGPRSPAWVQRVIAIPGDNIEIRDEQVLVNGIRIDESYAKLEGPIPLYREMVNRPEQRVPEGHVFMLGDNRRMSMDSRITGPVPIEDFIGRPIFIYWSTERLFFDPRSSGRYARGATRWERFGSAIQ